MNKKAIAIVLIIVGIAILAIFNWNVFSLDLPIWANIPSTIVGIPLLVWGGMMLFGKNT
ncbi:MAG: hypothetical protein FWD21_02375 [Peptococcaceae bacterium]|nr:hypothetical protein [Peptococcaceae bacterium]